MGKACIALWVLLVSIAAAQRPPIQDLNGANVLFSSVSGPITVVTFISTQCPVSNGYNDRMSALYRDYSGKGVKFLFVNANRNENSAEIAQHAKAVGFPFAVYKDATGELAESLDAQVTPESYVLDANGAVFYRGRIDDNRNQARVREKTLRLALDAVLSGKPVGVKQAKAFGCSIKRIRRTS